jgi:hypothetical protein
MIRDFYEQHGCCPLLEAYFIQPVVSRNAGEVSVMPTFLERYLSGECITVWDELYRFGHLDPDSDLFQDAWAVSQETMRRVRHNIEILIPRLIEAGYTFGYEWAVGSGFPSAPPLPVFSPPSQDTPTTIVAIEQQAGTLPLSLRAFYEIVGSVNFIGNAPNAWPQWQSLPDGLDALFVYPVADALQGLTSWQEEFEGMTEEDWDLPESEEEDICDTRAYAALPHDCWFVAIAPDEWHKYNISGCGAYEIAIPNAAADARLLTESHHVSFVSYLRHCFQWAGFPKLERVSNNPARITGLSFLLRDLLPI